MEFYWFIQAIAYFATIVFLIPYEYIKKLFPFAFIGGFIYTWIVQYIAVNNLGLWRFQPDIFTLLGIPVFFVLSWFAVTYVYGYLLYHYPKNQIWILLFFVSWASVNNYVSSEINQVFMTSWSIPHTFLFAIFSHIVLLYILKYMMNIDQLGAKKDMLSFSLAILKKR